MSVKRFVVVVALSWVALVGTLQASSAKVGLSEIRSFVNSVSDDKLSAFVADESLVVESAVNVVKKMRSTDQKVLDEILAQFATLPEFAGRKVTFRTFRVKSESFAPEAISLGDVIYVSETFIGKILFVPGGRGVLTAMLAHELSHHRDFLVKRAIYNDKSTSTSEKQALLLQVEIDADRHAVELLRAAGLPTDAMRTMLVGFGETERLHEVERNDTLIMASVGNDQQ